MHSWLKKKIATDSRINEIGMEFFLWRVTLRVAYVPQGH